MRNCFYIFFTIRTIIILNNTHIYLRDNLKKKNLEQNMYGCHCIQVSLVIVKRTSTKHLNPSEAVIQGSYYELPCE